MAADSWDSGFVLVVIGLAAANHKVYWRFTCQGRNNTRKQYLPCRVSPFFVEDIASLNVMTLPPSRCIAAMKELHVRVLFSKNISASTRPYSNNISAKPRPCNNNISVSTQPCSNNISASTRPCDTADGSTRTINSLHHDGYKLLKCNTYGCSS